MQIVEVRFYGMDLASCCLTSVMSYVLPQTANVDLVNALLGTGRGLLSSGGLVDSLVGLTFFFFFTPQVL